MNKLLVTYILQMFSEGTAIHPTDVTSVFDFPLSRC
jgi:hypothetical protein